MAPKEETKKSVKKKVKASMAVDAQSTEKRNKDQAPKEETKKSVKKVKASMAVDAQSTEKMNKDQLVEHIVRLREELDRVREEKIGFQLERDRVKSLCETSLRNQDQVKTELNHKQRKNEEAQERHSTEINKQKLKHVLSEQHSAVSELMINKTMAQILDQTQHQDQVIDLVQQRNGLQTLLREKQQAREDTIRDLELKQQEELMELMNDYDRKTRAMEDKYRALNHSLVQEHVNHTEREVAEVEQSAQRQLSELKTQHMKEINLVTEYTRKMSRKLESEENLLRTEWSKFRLKEARVNKKLSEVKSKNNQLKQDLNTAQQELPVLEQKLQQYYKDKEQEKKSRARNKALEEKIRGLRMEYTLLQQTYTKIQKEREELEAFRLQQEYDLQIKAGLEKALLKRKLPPLSLDKKKEVVTGSVAELNSTDRTEEKNKLK